MQQHQQQQQQQQKLEHQDISFEPKHPRSVRVKKPTSFNRSTVWTLRSRTIGSNSSETSVSTASSYDVITSSSDNKNKKNSRSVKEKQKQTNSTSSFWRQSKTKDHRRTKSDATDLVYESTCRLISLESEKPEVALVTTLNLDTDTINESTQSECTRDGSERSDLCESLNKVNSFHHEAELQEVSRHDVSDLAEVKSKSVVTSSLNSDYCDIIFPPNDDILHLNTSTGPVDVDTVLEDELADLECRILAREQLMMMNEDQAQHSLPESRHIRKISNASYEESYDLSRIPYSDNLRNVTKTSHGSTGSISTTISKNTRCEIPKHPKTTSKSRNKIPRAVLARADTGSSTMSSKSVRSAMSHFEHSPVDENYQSENEIIQIPSPSDGNSSSKKTNESDLDNSLLSSPTETENDVNSFHPETTVMDSQRRHIPSSSRDSICQSNQKISDIYMITDGEPLQRDSVSQGYNSTLIEDPDDSGPVDVDDYIVEGSKYYEFEYASIVLDEVEFSRGLAGYEVGFEPETIWDYDTYKSTRREFSRDCIPFAIYEKEEDENEAT